MRYNGIGTEISHQLRKMQQVNKLLLRQTFPVSFFEEMIPPEPDVIQDCKLLMSSRATSSK